MSSLVLNYPDLSSNDIAALTAFLSPNNTTIALSDLPSHLLSRIPFLAPGCQRHRKLNLAPLDDLVGALHHEAVSSIARVWAPLAEAGRLDAKQMSLFTALRAVADVPVGKCAACWLEFVGGYVGVLVATGAFVIGRVRPGVYGKSRRILWVEGALRAVLTEGAEGEVRGMWELGVGLRGVRKEWEGGRKGRGYVEEFERRAREMKGGPGKGKGRERDIDDLDAEECMNGRSLSDRDGDGRQTRPDPYDRPVHPEPPSSSINNTPNASQASSAHSSWWNNSTIPSIRNSTATSIIDLYRHSAFPDLSTFSVRSSTDSRKRSPVHVPGMPVAEEEDDLPGPADKGGERWTVEGKRDTIRQRREEGRGRGIVIGGLPYVPTGGVQKAQGWEVRRTRDGSVRCERGPLR